MTTPRTAATARERVTEGDFAKALHDGYKMLGYWPDPYVIDGRWEMWGVVLHSLIHPATPPTPALTAARDWTPERTLAMLDGIRARLTRIEELLSHRDVTPPAPAAERAGGAVRAPDGRHGPMRRAGSEPRPQPARSAPDASHPPLHPGRPR
jgi:hypothetical protein